MGEAVDAEIWVNCYLFLEEEESGLCNFESLSLLTAELCYFSFSTPLWPQDLLTTLVTLLCQMFSWLITDRPEAGLTEAKDRHTFFWKCRDDGRESLDINLFFSPRFWRSQKWNSPEESLGRLQTVASRPSGMGTACHSCLVLVANVFLHACNLLRGSERAKLSGQQHLNYGD